MLFPLWYMDEWVICSRSPPFLLHQVIRFHCLLVTAAESDTQPCHEEYEWFDFFKTPPNRASSIKVQQHAKYHRGSGETEGFRGAGG